jgi:serine/threonine protein kinase
MLSWCCCPDGCAAQGLDEVVIASIVRSVLQGLDYVHQNGGIHRDIKVGSVVQAAPAYYHVCPGMLQH